MHSAICSAASTPIIESQGSFARLCQSAVLIDRTVVCQREQSCSSSGSTSETVALAHEICSFIEQLETKTSNDAGLAFFEPCCLAWSALFALLDRYCCPEKLSSSPGYQSIPLLKTSDEQALQRQSIVILRAASLQILGAASSALSLAEASALQQHEGFGNVNPLGLDALYLAAMTFQWFRHESGDTEAIESLQVLRRCFEAFGGRWHLASEYLALEKRQDLELLS